MATTVRPPAVAGRFYPGERERLAREVESYLEPRTEKIDAIGCVAPHAGYMYSGHVAGAVYARVNVPERAIVLCPNHTGMGEPLAILSEAAWETPLGRVIPDKELADALKSALPYLTEDATAHRAEHALEVHLPFLMTVQPRLRFVPICVGTANLQVLSALGAAMAQVIEDTGGQVLMVSSSDMNHYEDDATTRVKDRKAIEKMLELDAVGLHDVVRRENISMCGFAPTVAMLTAAKKLGAKKSELVKYATSADVSGDTDYCVGYAGIVVS